MGERGRRTVRINRVREAFVFEVRWNEKQFKSSEGRQLGTGAAAQAHSAAVRMPGRRLAGGLGRRLLVVRHRRVIMAARVRRCRNCRGSGVRSARRGAERHLGRRQSPADAIEHQRETQDDPQQDSGKRHAANIAPSLAIIDIAEGDMETIGWDDFIKVELRVGRVVEARPFPEARKPAYVLHVDFGPELGVRKSSAQITDLYQPEELVGRLVVAVVNFPKKQIGPLQSECLVTGFHDNQGRVALCIPDRDVPPGTKLL